MANAENDRPPGQEARPTEPTGYHSTPVPILAPWLAPTGRALVRRWRLVTAVVVVVLVGAAGAATAVHTDASRVVERAEARHQRGDCAGAVAALDELGSLHRLVAGAVVDSSERGRDACEILDSATVGEDTFDPETLDRYVIHQGARWAHADVVLADMLLLLEESSYLPDDYFVQGSEEEAFELLTDVLEESPEESENVRGVMEAFLERYSAKNARYDAMDPEAEYCTTRDEHLDLLDRTWNRPEMAEPVAGTAHLRDEWLLACADETASADSLRMVEQLAEVTSYAGVEPSVDLAALRDGREIYDEYLEEYGDEPSADRARATRDRIVRILDLVRGNAARAAEHERVRDRAVARADRPADGTNVGACDDARCQVRVPSGSLVPIGGPGGPYEILVSVDGRSADVQLGGFIRSYSTTGGSIGSGAGYAMWSSRAGGELVLNDEVGIGIDGVRGSQVTLSVWRAAN